MYAGGTTAAEAKAAINAKATVSLQEYCSKRSLSLCRDKGQETVALHYPLGVAATDEFLMKMSELSGKPIPAALELERGRLIDAMTDSSSYIHGKTFSVFGDPDFCMGIVTFMMELGAEPLHVLATNGSNCGRRR